MAVDDYFNGYVTNQALDIDSRVLEKDITAQEMRSMAEQLKVSMSQFIQILVAVTIPISFIIIYLITKTILDASATDVSRLKVFGYRASELHRFYLLPTCAVFLISMAISFKLVIAISKYLINVIMAQYAGNISLYYEPIHVISAYGLILATFILVDRKSVV